MNVFPQRYRDLDRIPSSLSSVLNTSRTPSSYGACLMAKPLQKKKAQEREARAQECAMRVAVSYKRPGFTLVVRIELKHFGIRRHTL